MRLILSALIRDDADAVLVPIPQYPLYSAAISLLGGLLQPGGRPHWRGNVSSAPGEGPGCMWCWCPSRRTLAARACITTRFLPFNSKTGGTLVPYDLDESAGWALDMASLRAAAAAARAQGKRPRALVVINPGNPTGQVLAQDNLEELVR